MTDTALSVGIQPAPDGTNHGILQVSVIGVCDFAVRFCDQSCYEKNIAALIGGLMQLRDDFRQLGSGLIIAKGVNDADLRGNPQGGKQPGPRRPRKAGT